MHCGTTINEKVLSSLSNSVPGVLVHKYKVPVRPDVPLRILFKVCLSVLFAIGIVPKPDWHRGERGGANQLARFGTGVDLQSRVDRCNFYLSCTQMCLCFLKVNPYGENVFLSRCVYSVLVIFVLTLHHKMATQPNTEYSFHSF
jgi:hypothetical protein